MLMTFCLADHINGSAAEEDVPGLNLDAVSTPALPIEDQVRAHYAAMYLDQVVSVPLERLAEVEAAYNASSSASPAASVLADPATEHDLIMRYLRLSVWSTGLNRILDHPDLDPEAPRVISYIQPISMHARLLWFAIVALRQGRMDDYALARGYFEATCTPVEAFVVLESDPTNRNALLSHHNIELINSVERGMHSDFFRQWRENNIFNGPPPAITFVEGPALPPADASTAAASSSASATPSMP